MSLREPNAPQSPVPGPAQLGHPSTWPNTQPPGSHPPVATRSPAPVAWIIAGIAAAVVLLVAGFFVYNVAVSGNSAPTANDQLIALCHDNVAANLKTPSTAKFPPGDRISVLSDTRSKLVGAVDAQNLYGAMVRQHYGCEADRDGAGWKLVSVYLLD